jgi:nucleotide sugar dehydrogenase
VVQPALEEGGLKAGKDFYLAFSPERVDPGNLTHHTRNIPKVVGGINEPSTDLAAALYGSIIDTIVPVSSTQVAEMVKLLENTFRAVNIGLVNEIALMSHRMNIDVWEVIEAASTKPFGFMPFYPGPGLGGHCIPIDPVLPVVEGAAERFRMPVHRAGRAHQRLDARLRRRARGRSAQLAEEGDQRLAHPRLRRRLQEGRQ